VTASKRIDSHSAIGAAAAMVFSRAARHRVSNSTTRSNAGNMAENACAVS
jgi:hypothetical protein